MKLRTKVGIWFYAFFIQAGYFKADPRLSWLPVDLTILMALVVGVFLLLELPKSPKLSPKILCVLLLFVAFLPGLIDMNLTPYAEMKSVRFFTQTLLVAIGPFFLIKRECALKEFLRATVFCGILLMQDVIVQLVISRGAVWRINAFGSSVIAIGRSVGLVTVYYALQIIAGKRTMTRVALLVLSAVVLLVSGQRMAMVGPLVAVVVTLLLAFGIRFAHLRRALIIVLAAAVTISSSYFLLPLRSRERIDRFFKGGIGSFVASGNDGRAVALVNSLNESVNHPLGVGLGGFERHVGGLLEYPHNIVAETFLEGGWLAGLTLMLLICVSLFQGFLRIRMSFSDVDIAFFGLMLFTLFYSLVAGDLNGNRMLFAFIACSLSF